MIIGARSSRLAFIRHLLLEEKQVEKFKMRFAAQITLHHKQIVYLHHVSLKAIMQTSKSAALLSKHQQAEMTATYNADDVEREDLGDFVHSAFASRYIAQPIPKYA